MWSFVEKNRKLLAAETGSIVKDWGGKMSIALVYPNTYHVGMSNLAVHTLYKYFNDKSDIVCERAFLPDPKEIKEHQRTNTPILSIETQRPLSDFDCIAFSVSFQNDILNIPTILGLCSIPSEKSKRGVGYPKIIAGGAAVTMNHQPLAEIIDTCVIGEVENGIDDIVLLCRDKKEKMSILRRTPYPVRRTELVFPTQTVIYTQNTEFGDMHLIEMSRGCPHKCKFCATPALYSPYRQRSFEAIIEMVKNGLPNRKRFGLIGSDILAHKAFFEIAEEIHKMGATFSPSSLRVDGINDEVARLMVISGHKSVSLGIEAGSEKLRFAIGKRIKEDDIIKAAECLARHGINMLRLYFMIGLPCETDDDLREIATLSSKIKKIADKVTLTITPFVPKPGTFFENEIFAEERYLKRAIKLIKTELAKHKGLRANFESIKSAATDARLSKIIKP